MPGQPLIDDKDRLLRQCKSAGFQRVCELLYEERQDWCSVLECYVGDSSRHRQVFPLLRAFYGDHQSFSGDQLTCMDGSLLRHLAMLADLGADDQGELSSLLMFSRPHLIVDCVDQLAVPEQRLALLESLVLTGNQDHLRMELRLDLVERCVRLMAELQPQRVASFLGLLVVQDMDRLLDVCRRFRLGHASSVLLEKLGRLDEAYQVLLDHLKVSTEYRVPSTEY